MATVNKDFKIKSGLIVEGSTATVGGYDVLTKKQGDQDYIVGLIGGTATSANTANTVVKRDANGDFAAGTITADVVGDVTGDVTGQVSDISNHDTDDLSEGSTRLYFTNQRALEATSAAYDAAGLAAQEAGYVASDLSDHISDTSAHGVTGNVVGTSDTQTLTNKTIGDTLNFTGAGAMTINSDSHIVLTPAAGSSVKWGADVLATENYVDGEISTEVTNRNTAITTALTTAQGYADTAEGNANDYTDLLLGDNTVDGTSGNTVKDRIESAVADLVDGAPDLLNTLNELAAALGDDVEMAGGLATSIGNKLPKAGGTMSGDIAMGTNKVTGLGTPTANTDAATKGYVDGEISTLDTAAQGYASGAYQDAVDYADNLTTTDIAEGSNQYFTNQRAIDATASAYDAAGTAAGLAGNYDAAGTAQDIVDALTTSDIEEGSNSYFTDARAKTSAADLLTGATKTNITITGTGAGLTITAENGVADSDTDDLDEGTTHLYFTAERAVNALEAVVPNFTAVELNSVAKQVAATLSAATAGVQTAHAFAKAEYRSAEYLVKVAYATHTEISKVLLTLDTSDNISITEYGMVGTNGSLSAISAGISGSDVQLLVTTANNNSTVTVVGTLLA